MAGSFPRVSREPEITGLPFHLCVEVSVEVPSRTQGHAVGRPIQEAVPGNITTYPATAYFLTINL